MGNAECGQREERVCCVTAEVTVEDQRISWIFKFFEVLVLLDRGFLFYLPFYRSTVLPFYRSTSQGSTGGGRHHTAITLLPEMPIVK